MATTITLSRYTHHYDGTTHSAVLLNGQPVTREFVNDHKTAERYARIIPLSHRRNRAGILGWR